jgi:5-methylthioadenosine/S-adenosylhomocysteine deaminase
VSERTLIRGGCVLTLGARTPNFEVADVLIDDGKVAEVGPNLRARDAETVDATDTIVMPGFVDTHRHVWRSLFRNLGGTGSDAGSAAAFGRHYEPDDVYAATLIGLLGAVEAGITAVVDWADLELSDAHIDAALEAHADSGLRTVFVHAMPTGADVSSADSEAVLRRLLARFSENPGSSTTLAYGSSPDANLAQVESDWARAREMGLRIHTHAGSTPAERGVVAAMAGRGLLGRDVTMVQCSNLDDSDLDAIASTGASVALTPSSDMAGGVGYPPVQGLIDRGIRPGLGVDDERVAPGDIFAQMRAAISFQHATLFDLKLAGKAGVPQLLSTREVIRYATSDGARVIGLGEVTGSIEVGRQADIVVLRTDRPNVFPVNDPIGAVVWGMDTSNIDWVFSSGRALVQGGALEADVGKARDLATHARQRVAVAAGTTAASGAVEIR